MLTDFNDNIALAGDEDTKLELMDQLSYVKDSLSLFSKEETIGMDVEVSNLLASYAETEQAAYAEETSANNAGESDSSPSIKTLKSMLTDFNDNIALAGDEDTKLELMDQLSYVKDSLSLFSKEETIGMDVE